MFDKLHYYLLKCSSWLLDDDHLCGCKNHDVMLLQGNNLIGFYNLSMCDTLYNLRTNKYPSFDEIKLNKDISHRLCIKFSIHNNCTIQHGIYYVGYVPLQGKFYDYEDFVNTFYHNKKEWKNCSDPLINNKFKLSCKNNEWENFNMICAEYNCRFSIIFKYFTKIF